jgi:hypothetical protein
MVAHTHIDIGWAWRGTGAEDSIAVVNREAFVAHFARAGDMTQKEAMDVISTLDPDARKARYQTCLKQMG